MEISGMTGLIPLLPFLGAALWGLSAVTRDRIFGKATNRIVSFGAPLMVLASFFIAVAYFVRLLGMDPEHRVVHEVYFRWFDTALFANNIGFYFDALSITMVMMVTGVAFLIHVYSIGYMHGDPGFSRFFAYLNLFTSMMLILIMGDNILLMFVGWEGVGLCSYLLIGFWHKDILNASAGMKAFVTNRVGDFAFIIGMFTMFWVVGQAGGGYSLDFVHINSTAELLSKQTVFGMNAAEFVTLMLFIGATGKSAQIPLYVWLPDAMAGPTPVSALIHAATMVTAGVFMIGRLGGLFLLAPGTMTVVAIIGGVTSFFAATIAITQFDIKKVLAYSTVSQLGYMFLAMGVGAYSAGIFHLLTHAFFKALLFLGSGSVILGMHHDQDMRHMGGLLKKMKITGTTFLIGVLAIAGVFPFAGFFSKDEILFNTYLAGQSGHAPQIMMSLYILGMVTAAMTAFYMFRQFFMTFTGEFRGSPVVAHGDDHADAGHAVHAHAAHHVHGSHALHEAAQMAHEVHQDHGGHDDAHAHSHVHIHGHPPSHSDSITVSYHTDDHHGFHATRPEEEFTHDEPDIDEHHHGAHSLDDVHESPLVVTLPLMVLAFLAAVSGFLNLPEAMGGGAWFHEWLAPIWPHGEAHHADHSLELSLAGLSLTVALSSIAIASIFYRYKKDLPGKIAGAFSWVHTLLYHKYFVDELYGLLIVRRIVNLSHAVWAFDRTIVDGIVNAMAYIVRGVAAVGGWFDHTFVDGAVNALANLISWIGGRARKIQTGYINDYFYYVVGGAMIIGFVLMFF